MTIDKLRTKLLQEAISSPALLSDLAGLELYVSESYSSRSFIELLQNADDAFAEHFLVEQHDNFLYVANDGKAFTDSDIESLCRSASSHKIRGGSIGYRGIGFKSVVGIAKEVHLISGDFEITFSKELTQQAVPMASRVPLIRIPHPMRPEVRLSQQKNINDIQGRGYTTIFIFSGIIANQIYDEYSDISSTTLLFLNNLKKLEVSLSNCHYTITTHTEIKSEFNKWVTIIAPKYTTNWDVYYSHDCSIVFQSENGEIKRLSRSEGLLYAFLPTEDSSGMGIIINGDFSTDPSRRHLIFDENTQNAIEDICFLYNKLLSMNIYSNSTYSAQIVEALMPYYDINLIHLSKSSFEKLFSNQLKKQYYSLYKDIKLLPSWYNKNDFCKTCQHTISENCSGIIGIDSLFKFLGCKASSLIDILDNVNDADISTMGCVQIASIAIHTIVMNGSIKGFTDKRVFLSDGNRRSLQEINDKDGVIDDSFLQLLSDKGITEKEVIEFLKKLSLDNIIKSFKPHHTAFNDQILNDLHTNVASVRPEVNSNQNTDVLGWYNDISKNEVEFVPMASSINVKRWRSAEENILNILNDNGFSLEDVSKQNLGYDLEGNDPNGCRIYIEVKSIDYVGQKFRMTNNEFAAAQHRSDQYFLVIVLQTEQNIEFEMIKNPVKHLKMNRQCVQWIWECAEYVYNPIKLSLK